MSNLMIPVAPNRTSCVYRMDPMTAPLTADQVSQFNTDGCLFIKSFLDAEETALLQTACRQDAILQNHAMAVRDSQGRRTDLSLWIHPGDDI